MLSLESSLQTQVKRTSQYCRCWWVSVIESRTKLTFIFLMHQNAFLGQSKTWQPIPMCWTGQRDPGSSATAVAMFLLRENYWGLEAAGLKPISPIRHWNHRDLSVKMWNNMKCCNAQPTEMVEIVLACTLCKLHAVIVTCFPSVVLVATQRRTRTGFGGSPRCMLLIGHELQTSSMHDVFHSLDSHESTALVDTQKLSCAPLWRYANRAQHQTLHGTFL